MAIPSNLLPINNPIKKEFEELNLQPTVPQIPTRVQVPSNLLPINTSQVSASLQTLAGKVPSFSVDQIQIPQYALLNQAIPDRLFTTGSFEQIQNRALNAARLFTSRLQLPRIIPVIPALTIPFPPRRPSYGQIKNFIKTKIDRIKMQRQKASVRAVKDKLKRKENPYAYRKRLVNTGQQVKKYSSVLRGQMADKIKNTVEG